MTSEWRCTLNSQMYPVYIKYLPLRSQFLFASLHDQLFQDTRFLKIGTSDWSSTNNNPKYPIYTNYLPPRPKFSSVLLYDQPFWRYRVAQSRKFRKCTEWPQADFEIFNIQKYSYTLSNYLRGSNLGPSGSVTSRFRYTVVESWKLGNSLNDGKVTLNI